MALKVRKTVMIGHAVGAENGSHYGEPGNQTGKELRFQEWYNRSLGWDVVLRTKRADYRKRIAENMVDAVNNMNIGYNQKDRTSCYREAMNHHWNIAEIDTPCNTDCSALVSVCLNASGIKISKDIYTGNEEASIMATGEFRALVDEKYTKTPNDLIKGDILLGKGHTAIVVDVITDYIFDRVLSFKAEKPMQGDDVKLLQTTLKKLGIYKSKCDGILGSKTGAAIVRYQKEKGLVADGIAGKKTIQSMGYKFGG